LQFIAQVSNYLNNDRAGKKLDIRKSLGDICLCDPLAPLHQITIQQSKESTLPAEGKSSYKEKRAADLEQVWPGSRL
jgi:hypothetical protein